MQDHRTRPSPGGPSTTEADGRRGTRVKSEQHRALGHVVRYTRARRALSQGRLKRALDRGLLIDLAGGGRGKAKRIVLGDRLDYEDGVVLPTPAKLEEVCGGACTTA